MGSHEGHCDTVCWCRLAWLCNGGTWEMWTLAQARAGIVQRSPGALWGKSVALPQPPLPAACWADCFEGSGWRWRLAAGSRADRRWKRKWDPRWERQFFRGRVCFNAGLSCTAVLAYCYWQHWSLERCLTLPMVSFRALSCLLCAAGHSPHCSRSGTQQLSLLDGGAAAACAHRGRACCSLPAHTPSLAVLLPASPLSQPSSSWASSLACPPGYTLLWAPIPSNCPATSICIAFYAAAFYGGGSAFALRECFWAVARAEEWQMGGDERIRSVMNLFFLPCLKLPVKIQQPHLRSA